MLHALIACTEPAPGPKLGDTAIEDTAADDTGKGEEPFPWTVEGFWEPPGPLPSLLEEQAGAFERVRLATSADGVAWTVREAPVAWGMSSLNLFVVDDVGVIVVALVEQGVGVELRAGDIYALASTDLETWTTAAWPVSDLDDLGNLVDPSLSWTPRGELQLVYYATDFLDGDPVDYPGDHRIRRAVWREDHFAAETRDLYLEEGLADPVTCRVGTTEYLFATKSAQEIRVAVREADQDGFTRADHLAWPDRTVPWCREEADGVTIYGQTTTAPMAAYEAFLSAEGTLEETRELYASSPFGGEMCASVGVARFREEWVLVCVEINQPE